MQKNMHKELEKEISRYLNDIKCLMPGDNSSKRKYLRGLKNEIYDYAEENEVVSMGDIVLHFGEEEEVAKLYVDTLDVKSIKRKYNFRRIIISVLISALVVWGVAAAAGSAISRAESDNGVVVVVDTNERS